MRILITSTQYPHNGGSATNSYALIKFLRKRGYKVAGIFFENKKAQVDPDRIGGVFRSILGKNDGQIVKAVNKYLGGPPNIIFGKNYAAPVYSKSLYKNTKVAYLVTGSPQMRDASAKRISAQRYLKSKDVLKFDPELRCINKSDLVIPNSPIGKALLVKNYGMNSKYYKPVDTSLAFNYKIKSSKNFHHRNYDIAFVCSNVSRTVKNADLVKRLYRSKPLAGHKKIVVGRNSKSFSGLPNTTIRGMSSQKDVISVLKNSKLVICSSYYDASPNVIKEAISCGSNILISKNCGWSEKYPKEFVCDDVYNLKRWIGRTKLLTQKDINFSIKKDESKLGKELDQIIKAMI